MSNGGRATSSTSPTPNPTMSSTSSAASVSSPSAGISEGQIIEHQRFGRGKVVKVEGVGENAKATVDFDTTGRKQLLLKFARFNMIG